MTASDRPKGSRTPKRESKSRTSARKPVENATAGATIDELRMLVDRSPDVLVELGLDGRTRFVSQSAEFFLGRDAISLTGISFLEVVVPEDHAKSLAAFQKVAETGAPSTVVFRIPRTDGVRIVFETRLRSFIDEQGQQRIVASCRDVSEQIAAESHDKQQHSHYRALAESGSRAATIANADGEILFANRNFELAFGRLSSLLEIAARTSPESRSQIETDWNRASHGLPSGSIDLDYYPESTSTIRPPPVSGRDFEATLSDEDPAIWYSVYWERFETDDGSHLYTCVFDDITRRKQIEQALRMIARQAVGETRGGPQDLLPIMGRALELDRIVLARVSSAEATESALELDTVSPNVEVLFGWSTDGAIPIGPLDLDGLPDAAPATGEACVHPTGLAQTMPRVRDLLGHNYDAYVGLPIRLTDGTLFGFLSGYSRKAIRNTDLTRSLIASFATQLATHFSRDLADRRIREIEARFDAMANDTMGLLIEFDEDQTILYASEGVRDILGRAPEEMIGLKAADFTHPDDEPIIVRHRAEVSAGKAGRPGLIRARHRDGEWRSLDARTIPFRAVDGSMRAMILARDATELLQESLGQELLYRVVQETADMIAVCTPGGRIQFANQAARETLALSEGASLEGQTLFSLLDPASVDILRNDALPNLREENVWTGELCFDRRGEADPIITEATIVFFQEHHTTSSDPYLAVTLRDITSRREAETALKESELRLGQAQKMEAVGRLAGGIAHDFNNLLTAIIGYSELVLDQLGPDHGVRRDAEEVMHAAERAGGLTRQLLAFGKRQVFKREPVDLDFVLSNIDRMMRRLIAENIELVTIQHGDLWTVEADEGQLEQVIVNLVVNARDAMPTGGRLQLETSNEKLERDQRTLTGVLKPGEYVVLRVTDDGHGIDQKTLHRIFEPFFTTKPHEEGTGLGLATVYAIVTEIGGQIDTTSERGKGTQFSIFLPASSKKCAAEKLTETRMMRRGSETILLVEDAAPVRRLVKRTLTRQGYTVLTAESASAALRICGRHPETIDLLLTDVVLPTVPGPEIAARIRAVRPQICVLYMSGFPDETLQKYGVDRRVSLLLEKPFTPQQVLGMIRSVLDEPVATPDLD